ncbi:hypothetical protein GGR42_002036 [Saonia flava]|uniref:Collagen-like protein n=1 Tax=Saonia flava TaxID=523696 RepID=A0A846R2H8_9FLAO|nr:collagen-like protein [Saonia flava]NJB71574.1 hypothetical protein [Saonia flava]
MNNFKYFSLLTLFALLFLGCSKDGAMGLKGEQGEQGIPGPAGLDGEDGEQGLQGEQGEIGTANVIYSEWFTLQFPDDIEANNYVSSIDAPALTAEVVENGVVLAYGRYFSNSDIGVIEQIPFISFSINQHYSLNYTTPPASNSGRVFIKINSIDGGPIGSPLFFEYRYIIIPGEILTGGKSSGTINYLKMSYKEILILFNIPE